MTDSDTESPHKAKDNMRQQKLPKHMRLRYWTSYEEMRLVELWQQHSDEITVFDRNMPIYRTIADSMKLRKFYLNPQEVRRKINAIRNKYLAERKRLEGLTKDSRTSNWRLYPLVDLIVAPKQRNTDFHHEDRLVRQILSQLSTLQAESIPFRHSLAYKRVKYKHDDDVAPFLITDSNVPDTKLTTTNSTASNNFTSNKNQQQIPPTKNVARVENVSVTPTRRAPSARHRYSKFLPITGHVTMEQIERLRDENRILALQRDQQLRSLQLKEHSFKQFQTIFIDWQQQQQQLLHTLICRAGGDS